MMLFIKILGSVNHFSPKTSRCRLATFTNIQLLKMVEDISLYIFTDFFVYDEQLENVKAFMVTENYFLFMVKN